MADPAGTRLVVNSLVLNELALQMKEATAGRHIAPDTLLETIRKHKHILCTTDNIKKEYAKTEKSGQYRVLGGLLTQAIRDLDTMGMAKQCRTGSMPDPQVFAGFGRRHRAFLEDALKINAAYLLTANESWLEKAAIGNVQIVISARYVQLQMG